ncbi:MAG: anaerobic ribonucleoside-triphosphate reductase, partial [Bacteroides sp.]
MRAEKYNNQYRKYVNFIKKYRQASNASTGSEVDSNANVENKNVTTCTGELYKREGIGTSRLLMIDKITELFGSELAEEYIRQLEVHDIYKHDETNPIMPYCVSITMYPFLFDGLKSVGGLSIAPKNTD